MLKHSNPLQYFLFLRWLAVKALEPNAVLSFPEVLESNAFLPVAVFPLPVVFCFNASTPIARVAGSSSDRA